MISGGGIGRGVQKKLNEHHYWILNIWIRLSTTFQLRLTIVIFWTKFAKNGSYFQSKTDKIDTTIEFCIFELAFVSNFTLNNFEFLDQICPRKIFMVKNRKSEHHHWIPHIQISLLVPNFCFNWQFWFFWPDLSKKSFSRLKQKKWTQHIFYIILQIQINLVRNFSLNWQFWFFGTNLPPKTDYVNITMEFCIVELV